MKHLIIIWLTLFFCTEGRAQYNFDILQGRKEIKIPFEMDNNFMVVEVTLNQLLPMRFIFDTGAEHTILSKGATAGILGLTFEREFNILGADLKTELTAYLTRRVHVTVGDAIFPSMDMLVLKEDYFRMDEFTGSNIHGILGADFFRRFVVKINYHKRTISLINHNRFKPSSKYTKIPVKILRHKPYIQCDIKLSNKNERIPVKMLMDSGASLALLVHNETSPMLELPENVINGKVGMGLGGTIDGFLGRLEKYCIGPFCFDNVVTNFQSLDHVRDTTHLQGRNGLIGSVILQRFIIVIDYISEELYLRPLKYRKKAFKYDRSGIGLIASGPALRDMVIHYVLDNSPAAEVGLQPGDKILRINGLPTKLLSLHNITYKLQRRVGKKVRLVIERGGQKIKVGLLLRDLI